MSLVELYYLPIDQHGFDIDLETCTDVLDPEELARYQRFKSEHARDCFLQARRIVKTELAKKLNCSPSEVLFDYTQTEKPYLKNHSGWQFNISHSQSTIVVAISEYPVGVDVEDVDRCLKIWHKAEDFLNAHVKTRVDKGRDERESASIFAEHWSCTESYIKLKGSAIYREKDRVKAHDHSRFWAGKRLTFEDTFFTVFTFSDLARISVATEKCFPMVEIIYWRTEKRVQYVSDH